MEPKPPQVCNDAPLTDESRFRLLEHAAYQLLALPSNACSFDLQDDVSRLDHTARASAPVDLDTCLALLAPLPLRIPVSSGRAALSLLLDLWRREDILLIQNHLSPDTLYQQLSMGLSTLNLALTNSAEDALPFSPELDLERLAQQLAGVDQGNACVFLELAGSFHGGQPLSLDFLQELSQLLRQYKVPLVFEISHLWDQCLYLMQIGQVASTASPLDIAALICALADMVVGNFSVQFGLDRGGIIALRDPLLARELVRETYLRGCQLTPTEERVLAHALANPEALLARTQSRLQAVAKLHDALAANGVPVLSPCGGHAFLIDARKLHVGHDLTLPAVSLGVALFAATGIRALIYRHGELKLDNLLLFNLPLGLDSAQHIELEGLLLRFFRRLKVLPRLERADEGYRLLSELQTDQGPCTHCDTDPNAAVANSILTPLDKRWRSHGTKAPLTLAQSRIWFLNLIEGEGSGFNMYQPMRLKGALDLQLVEAGLDNLVQRHEILRTIIGQEEGVPFQQAIPAPFLPLTVVDLSQLPQGLRDKATQMLLRQWITCSINLGSLPALRRAVLRLGSQDQVLLLLLHHIFGDGWTLDMLTREWCTYYCSNLAGREPDLPALTYQYADYAYWQQGLDPQVFADQCAWWANELGGCPPILELPTDRPRPPIQSYHGALLHDFISLEQVNGINVLARNRHVSLFIVVMAVFKVLMFRYSGQRDFAVGTPVANRNRDDFEDIAGLFMNAVVLRSHLDPALPFSRFLAKMTQTILEALDHQDVPFELLADVLKPERNPSHPLWFQVMLNLNRDPMRDLDLPGVSVSLMEAEAAEAKLDLTLYLFRAEDGIKLVAEYNTDLFDAGTIRAMLSHYRNLIQGAIVQPDQALGQLEILNAAERQLILETWNGSDHAYNASPCLHQLFEAEAARRPDQVAVVMGDGASAARPNTYSYSQLNRRANALARRLAAHGAGPDRAVGIYVDRSPELFVAILAVLKSGSCYVPLDPDYPAARLSYMVENAQASLIISRSGLLETMPQSDAQLLLLEDSETDVDQGNFSGGASASNMVYIIYSSGSTGKPKGIALAHAAIVSMHHAWNLDYNLAACTSHLQVASFCFDVFAGDLARSLCSGAKLVICPAEYKLEPSKLHQLMCSEQIDFVEFVPAVVKLLCAWLGEVGRDLRFLRVISVGSDAWTMSDFVQLKRLLGPHTLLVNSYGVTEAAVDSTRFSGSALPLAAGRTAPIGQPFPNCKIYILDRAAQPVPIGVYGILYIGGPGLARDYFKQPGLTATKFVPNPYGQAGTRLYCTNDAARYLSDGNIEFLGRVDNQVKLRGFRIELGEIEGVLLEQDCVREAAVQIRDDGRGQGEASKHLVAYVAIHQGQSIKETALRALLGGKLPKYMVPAYFVFLRHLPLTPNGKTDHRALSSDAKFAPNWGNSAPLEPTKTPVEIQLAEIWCQILGLQQVGRNANFFESGGHSLLATCLVAAITRILGITLPLKVVFDTPILADMAEFLDVGPKPASPITHQSGPVQRIRNKSPFSLSAVLDGSSLGSRLKASAQIDPQERAARTADIAALSLNERAAPCQHSVQALFRQQVEARPHGLALVWASGQMTYKELERRANSLAAQLRGLGLRDEEPVGVMGDRSAGSVCAVLAVLMAGGCYVPLDPENPLERTREIAQSVGMRLLLGGDAAAFVESFGLLRLDPAAAPEPADLRGSIDSESLPNRLCYMIFTSGSTGKPKGVAVAHQGLVRLVRENGFLTVSPEDRILQVSNFAFDAVNLELWAALLNGATLVLSDGQLEHLPSQIAEQRITVLHLTAQLFTYMVDDHLDTLVAVSHVLTGGDAISGHHAARFMAAGGKNLTCCYGPTEVTTLATTYAFPAAAPLRRGVPLGLPLGNTSVYVLGPKGQPVALGESGELWIGGLGLARGYFNQPGLSAEHFVPNPFASLSGHNSAGVTWAGPGDRLYRSGDLARWTTEGVLEFGGRIDAQLKIRGYRIEVEEIEARLAALPEVRDVIVDARELSGDKRLIAWLTCKAAAPDPARLRDQLAADLPAYMIPSAFVCLESFPRLLNGKVNRKLLPLPVSEDDPGYRAPVTLDEKKLAAIWADVFGLARVGLDDEFFHLGGHSLLAVRILTRIEHDCNAELSLPQLLTHPRLEQQARLIEQHRQQGVHPDWTSFSDQQRAQGLALSPAQARLWFHAQLEPESCLYSVPMLFHLVGSLDQTCLRMSLQTIVERHEILRTRYREVDGQGLQIIEPMAPLSLASIDLCSLARPQQELLVQALLETLMTMPMDLREGPVFTLTLFRLDPANALLLFNVHHIAFDFWSTRVLLNELTLCYRAFRQGLKPRLARLPLQYAEVAHYINHHPPAAASLDFWRDTLAGLPQSLTLPYDSPRSEQSCRHAGTCTLLIPAATCRRLRQLSQQWSATPYSLILAAYALSLSRWSGQRDLCIGTPSANRTHARVRDLIGFFVNTLALRLRLQPNSFVELAEQVRMAMMSALAHQDVPFEQVVALANIAGSRGQSGLFQVMFSFLERVPIQELDSGLKLDLVQPPILFAMSDLILHINDDGETLFGQLVYDQECFHRASAEGFLELFLATLDAACEEPHAPLELDAVTAAALRGQAQARAAASQNLISTAWRSDQTGPLLAPLSSTQQRLWFIDCFEGGTAAYNIPSAFLLEGPLAVDLLQRGLDALVLRHESLRTNFIAIEGVPYQEILPQLAVPISLCDLSQLPQTERESVMAQLCQQLFQKPFNLAQAPLIRFQLLRVSASRHVLAFDIHHIISDAWSSEVFSRELAAAYSAGLRPTPFAPPALRVQYADFARWQQLCLGKPRCQQDLLWWKQLLQSFPPGLDLPTDYPRPTILGFGGGQVHLNLRGEGRSLLSGQRVSPFMLHLTSFAYLLSRYCGQSEITLGTPIANRSQPELEPLIGFFANTIALPLKFAGQSSFKTLLQQTRDLVLEAFSRTDTPFEKVVEAVQPDRASGRTPLFQAIYSYLEGHFTPSVFPGLRLQLRPDEEPIAKFELSLFLGLCEGGYRGTLVYNRELWQHETIVALVRLYENIHEQLLGQPDQPLAQLDLLSVAERQALLQEWNPNCVDYPRHSSVVALFEGHCQRTPEAIAFYWQERSYSYQECNSQANRIAHWFAALGLATGDTAAFSLPRSADALFTLLAILKCGAAYVPIDAKLPAERIKSMVSTSAAKFLITLPQGLHADLVPCCYELHEASYAPYPETNLGRAIEPLHTAYVMYTSGSTGEPKGVAITHRGVVRLAFGSYMRHHCDQVILHGASLSFDMTTLEIWCALLHGAALEILEEGALDRVGALLRQGRITETG